MLEDEPAHLSPQPRPLLGPPRLRAPGRLIGALLSTERPIPGPTTVDGDLPADRAPMTTHTNGDGGVGLAPLDSRSDLFAFGQRQRVGPAVPLSHHDHTFVAGAAPHRVHPHPAQSRRRLIGGAT